MKTSVYFVENFRNPPSVRSDSGLSAGFAASREGGAAEKGHPQTEAAGDGFPREAGLAGNGAPWGYGASGSLQEEETVGRSFPGEVLFAGCGFTREGLWREGAARAAGAAGGGLVVDDRFLPSPRGLEQALRFLSTGAGPVIFDFERPPEPRLARLVEALEGLEAVVPPHWAHLPHSRVLVGPYLPGMGFRPWLEAQLDRYGALVLDGAPLRHRTLPGQAPALWDGPLPAPGLPCPGALCLHRLLEDGSAVFWDTKETLTARARAAGVPILIYGSDWVRL